MDNIQTNQYFYEVVRALLSYLEDSYVDFPVWIFSRMTFVCNYICKSDGMSLLTLDIWILCLPILGKIAHIVRLDRDQWKTAIFKSCHRFLSELRSGLF